MKAEIKAEIKDIITRENNDAIYTILTVAKQDIAIEIVIKGLNELSHINRLEFTAYGETYGITDVLLQEIKNLKHKLTKAKYGRF